MSKLCLKVSIEDKKYVLSDSEIANFSSLWQQDKVKAGVYAVKGFCLFLNGFEKYEEAAGAFKTALELSGGYPGQCNSWMTFYWQYYCAFCLSRKPSSSLRHKSCIEEEEKTLWLECRKWVERRENLESVDYNPILIAEFLARYADARVDELWDGRSKLMGESLKIFRGLNEEQKHICKGVFRVAARVYQKGNLTAEKKQAVIDEAEKYIKNDGHGLLEISKLYADNREENQKAVNLLERGKKEIDSSSNFFCIDLGIAHRKSKLNEEIWAQRKFEGLLKKYGDDDRNHAIILTFKSDYLRSLGRIEKLDESFRELAEAKIKYKALVVPPEHKINLMKNLEDYDVKRPEYKAWYASNYDKEIEMDPADIIARFERVVSQGEDYRLEFAREHLGRFLLTYESNLELKTQNLERAAELFRKLPTEPKNKYRKFLLSETVVKQFKDAGVLDNSRSSNFQNSLIECLELGNCDAIEPILQLLEKRKSDYVLNDLHKPNFFAQDQSHLFFSRKTYELCAKIKILIDNNCRTAFFVDEKKSIDEHFRKKIHEKVANLLEFPTGKPKEMDNIWRRRRLEATKKHLEFEDAKKLLKVVESASEEEYELNIKLMDVLQDSRSPLDRYFKKLSSVAHCYHSFAFKAEVDYQKEQSDRMERMLKMDPEKIKQILIKDFKAAHCNYTKVGENEKVPYTITEIVLRDSRNV